MSNLKAVIERKREESQTVKNFFTLGFSVGFAVGCLFFAVIIFV